ncbi:biopolymer transporter ExbD [Comamonadaceae bacterium OTU4NAUVB1]|jgi:biopolymer transport protein ExbD|nr:biopolymer transporter ExbD [Comamonadaceae bacterium OTU4NAUVB1]HSU22977.1 biopolymer transporter ExbD [Variovorax sp.]
MTRPRLQFRRAARDEPEINLIPFIDVLLVVLIFLMLSTTYGRFTELQLRLPAADTETRREVPRQVVVAVAADGRYVVGKTTLDGQGVAELATAIGAAAEGPDSVVVIDADERSSHQSVVRVMEAARRAGLLHMTFGARASAQGR